MAYSHISNKQINEGRLRCKFMLYQLITKLLPTNSSIRSKEFPKFWQFFLKFKTYIFILNKIVK